MVTRAPPARFAWIRSAQCLGAAERPQSANRTASASVDFPLPRAPMMQVRPWGILTLRPGRNPPLISIFSTTHIGSVSASLNQPLTGHCPSSGKPSPQHPLLYTKHRFVPIHGGRQPRAKRFLPKTQCRKNVRIVDGVPRGRYMVGRCGVCVKGKRRTAPGQNETVCLAGGDPMLCAPAPSGSRSERCPLRSGPDGLGTRDALATADGVHTRGQSAHTPVLPRTLRASVLRAEAADPSASR